MTKGFFITGTNTGVGKTVVTCALLRHFSAQGMRTLGLKPVASGCERAPEGLRNEDALLIQASASIPVDYQTVNPFAFEPAIAPHIAAEEANAPLSCDAIVTHCQSAIATHQPDWVLVEGAGGWQVPLNRQHTFPALAQALQLPVVLVVGLELGCINHTLLTHEAIRAAGLPFAGWIANSPTPAMERLADNIETLSHWLNAQPMAVLPYSPLPLTQKIKISL